MAARATAREQRVWTVMDVIRASGEYLDGKGLEHGRLDAEHLLAHVLDAGRLHLYLHFDRPLSVDERGRLKPLLRRRGQREPLQYILGSAPFRELVLDVDRRVAIPRPETEYLIDVLQRAAGRDRVFESALDVGTGSGAIALALATEGLARAVTATDISTAALAVARNNAAASGVATIDFREGRLLEPVAGRTFDLVLSNPPYLTEEEWRSAQPEVRQWEPRTAMVSGEDGLEVIRGLVNGLGDILRPGGWVGLEVGNSQAETVVHMLEAVPGLDAAGVHDDLTGRPRYVLGRKTGEPQAQPIA
ncbi:MAG: peptide chain release factor N(5)-glutamine methyltransferase [Gemmatimonadetes bacterium]|nr:peptide chain release factor N(5)-glutamine methyltransferase [Gemmatimonadota bacterium]MYA65412.1 peptide chain release factor N(5)-glutamine methyltransferase [Gemmatimonadota bacterium]MYB97340.1 peptide chain release factor N(5)-glutamine methyltransferase [Gemmatimonadota bacterium]MYH51932.1 peptide chain release factor N(5)-glutamine methyltransferase [Gemmatimonadota bacterium]MYI47280.1 peptide chain release factor N(5)-glutamine methyltransferase [Gemmatimonadota bacterium]